MKSLLLTLCIEFAIHVHAIPSILSPLIIHEKRGLHSSSWQQISRAQSDTYIPIKIALAQQNIHQAEEELYRISSPSSSDFGKHWSQSKVTEFFSPAPESTRKVLLWLSASGISSSRVTKSVDQGWLSFNSSVVEAEGLLQTTFHIYGQNGKGTHFGCENYSIPEHLTPVIDFIVPTIQLFSVEAAAQRPSHSPNRFFQRSTKSPKAVLSSNSSSIPSYCKQLTTPACLRSLYYMPSDESILHHPNSSVGALQLTMGRWRPNDLEAFFEKYAPSLVKQRPDVVGINGGQWQNDIHDIYWSLEANLDFEYIMTLTNRTALNYQAGSLGLLSRTKSNLNSLLAALDGTYCEALNNPNDTYFYNQTWPFSNNPRAADCSTIKKLPSVLSISYGWDENEFPTTYLRRQCLQFLKMGLQGVTVIVSSGDSGTAGTDGKCLENGRFLPGSPSTCPYVTSVGGTQIDLRSNSSMENKEIAASWIRSNISGSSGGGFSNVFGIPKYQRATIERYFHEQNKTLSLMPKLYDTRGRGFPDVAAVAKNFVVMLNGEWITVDGTSGSAPVFASIITLINDRRLSAGKSTVGFVNPVLYAYPSAFNDITEGHNEGCGTIGFTAGHGWDPVTGLGSPNFEKLLKLYQNLP